MRGGFPQASPTPGSLLARLPPALPAPVWRSEERGCQLSWKLKPAKKAVGPTQARDLRQTHGVPACWNPRERK